MLSPFTRDELELVERDEFLRHALAVDPELTQQLEAMTSGNREGHLVSNELGHANHGLIDALDRFIATEPSEHDARVAQGLCFKLRAAFEAAERP